MIRYGAIAIIWCVYRHSRTDFKQLVHLLCADVFTLDAAIVHNQATILSFFRSPLMNMPSRFYNEMFADDGGVRPHYGAMNDWLKQQTPDIIADKRRQADLMFHKVGITFAVYGEEDGAERLIPFDIIPRVFPKSEWSALERGLRQRVQTLNMFLHDVYHEQNILKAGIIPPDRIFNNAQYRPEMQGVNVATNLLAHQRD